MAENVKGLLRHDDSKTLKTMLKVFSKSGYQIQYKVLNAWDYNVPQKRERIIIIRIRNDLEDIKFHWPTKSFSKPLLKDTLKNVPKSPFTKYSQSKVDILSLVPPGGNWKNLPDEVAKKYMGKSYYSGGGKTGIARRLKMSEPSLTILTSPSQKQTERCHPLETRHLTVRESARIQTFPDSWIFKGSISSQYKQIGNAVPVNLALAIGLSILQFLKEVSLKENSYAKI